MPSKLFDVSGYIMNLGYKGEANWGGVDILIQGYLVCRGNDGSRLIFYGLHPSSPVPPRPVCDLSTNTGAIFIPFADLHDYVDLVRYEKPITARLDSDHPEWMWISTGIEPTGEQEGHG